jgi:hypothetical protein
VSPAGQPVWYLTLPTNHANVGDFQKQPDGTYTVAVFDSSVVLPSLQPRLATFIQYDNLGNELREWRSPDCLATNEHEIRLLPDGSALLYGYVQEAADLSEIIDGGSTDGGVWVSRLERLSPDGGILFSWDEKDYIPITYIDPSVTGVGRTDPYHTNAIDILDGGYLISNFHMSQLVEIDSTTGAVNWILGGGHSDFTFLKDPLNGPSFQHGARQLPNGHIILFDNGDGRKPLFSRATEYALDFSAMTATLVWQAVRPQPVYSDRFGFADRLANGNTLITYGANSIVDEVLPDGGVVWELTDTFRPPLSDGGGAPLDIGIYRAYRVDTLY